MHNYKYNFVDLQCLDLKLLTWTAEDVTAHNEQARTLGALLEAGENLYRENILYIIFPLTNFSHQVFICDP